MSHAAVAAYYDPAPAFVLGAMLPDFFGMLSLRVSVPEHAKVKRGEAFHHVSDAAFHDAPAFVELTRAARAELFAAGVPKGPARAVAHIGVELLLDPVFLDLPEARVAYTRAIAHGDILGHELALTDDDSSRLGELLRLLAARGLPSGEVAHDVLSARIRRALAGRPRLALDDRGETLVRNWVVKARANVVECASDVVRQLLSTLDAQGFHRVTRGVSEGP